MNSPQQTSYSNDDEISLVDLAVLLVKRWKLMLVIFLLVLLAAVAYALLTPRSYQYTSVYNVAEQGPGDALEAPKALVAKARSLYVGPETRELLASEGLESLPFELSIANPEQTLLVTLTSQASETNEALVAKLHEGVLARLQEGQQAMVERRKQALQRQLESAGQALEAAQQSESMNSAEIVSMTMSRISELEAETTELRLGDINQSSVKSLSSFGVSRTLILALGIVLGTMLAIIGAFLSHFVSAVCRSLTKN